MITLNVSKERICLFIWKKGETISSFPNKVAENIFSVVSGSL